MRRVRGGSSGYNAGRGGKSGAIITSMELTSVAHVTLIGNLRQLTGGVTELEISADSVRQLFLRLGERFPDLAPHLEDGLAVAIDGQIYQDALFQDIAPDSEVHVLPQIAGG